MSGRGAKRRGRPPKTPTVDRQSSKFQYHLLKKPKYLQNKSVGSDSQLSTPTQSRPSSPHDSESSRRSISRPSTSAKLTSSRKNVRGTKRGNHSATTASRNLNSSTYSKKGYESEYLYGSDFGDSSDENDGDDDLLSPSETDSLIGDHESESDFSLSSLSNGSCSKRTPRQPSPEPLWLQRKDLPLLELPQSSDDLLVSLQYSLKTVAIYEVLRRFKYLVRLSPFRLEDFCAALLSEDQSSLLTEIHIMLMKAILREEDSQTTHFGPLDQKDSVNISLYLIDQITWPDVLRSYVESDASFDRQVLKVLSSKEYPYTNISDRLIVLQFLTDQFLITTPVRDNMLQEGPIHYDDHCRICHRLGDLLCCETCPSVFHLECVDPPLIDVPTEDWQCSICKTHQLSGVYDCMSTQEKQGLLCRYDHIGFDRHGRKYWFIARRIFVEKEDENKIWYYSTTTQFDLLLSKFDQTEMESALFREMTDMKDEIIRQMKITENLTNQYKGNKISYLEIQNQHIEKLKHETNDIDDGNIDGKSTDNESKKIKEDTDNIDSSMSDNLMEEMIDIRDVQEQSNLNENDINTGKLQQKKHITRLKTGAITSRTFNQDDTKRKRLNDNTDADTRTTRQKCNQTTTTETTASSLFRLGMENGYKTYINQFTTNAYALNKPQRNEERDKKRHMSHKFSLTTASEFKWLGSFNGTQTNIISTIRQTLLALEQSMATPFLHPNWIKIRKLWVSAVTHCNSPYNLAIVLVILQSCLKSPVFANVWHEQLGHYKLQRITSNEREERKKIEKREKRERDDEEERNRLAINFVKYSLGLKHQVWKQKGEEYRIHGQWGWIWMAYSRKSKSLPNGNNPMASEKCMAKVFHLGAYKILSLKYETLNCIKSNLIADISLAEMNNEFESIDVSRALTAPGRLLYPKLGRKSKLDELLARRIHLRDMEEQKFKSISNGSATIFDEPPSTTIIAERPSISNIENYLDKIINQLPPAKHIESNIDTEFVNTLAEQILKSRVQFFQLNRFSKLYRCYNRECNKTDSNVFSLPQASLVTCYSPLCLQKSRVRRDLLISLRKAHQANSETAAAIMNVVNSKKPSNLKSKLTDKKAICTEIDIKRIDMSMVQKDIKDALSNEFDFNEFDVSECITLAIPKKEIKSEFINNECKQPENKISSNEQTEQKDTNINLTFKSEISSEEIEITEKNVENLEQLPPVCEEIDITTTNINEITSGNEHDQMNKSLRARVSPRKTRSFTCTTTNTMATDTVITSVVKSELDDGTIESSSQKQNNLITETQQTKYKPHPNRRFAANSIKSIKKDDDINFTKEYAPDGITERVYTCVSSNQKIYLRKSLLPSIPISHASYSPQNDKSTIRFLNSKLPMICDFRTKKLTKSIMVLPKYELIKLARNGGRMSAYGFHPLAKTNMSVWPYPCSRPLFKTSWLFRTLNVKTFSAIALQLRIIWCCLKWDDMATKPPTSDGKHQVHIVTKFTIILFFFCRSDVIIILP